MEVVGVVLEPERLVRAAEAEVVGGDRPRSRSQLRDDLPVEVRPGRLAVQQQDGRAVALVEVVQAQPVLLDVVRLEVVAGQALEVLVGRAVGVGSHAPSLRSVRTRRSGKMESMAEPPPPRDPQDPADDETVVVPPCRQPVDETIVRDEWGPETVVAQPGRRGGRPRRGDRAARAEAADALALAARAARPRRGRAPRLLPPLR